MSGTGHQVRTTEAVAHTLHCNHPPGADLGSPDGHALRLKKGAADLIKTGWTYDAGLNVETSDTITLP